jgi:hypothetical protein
MGRRRAALPQKVKELRTRIERWRRTRRKRSAMPEGLWSDATLLARAHGIHRVSSALRINYENLKKRVDVAPDDGGGDSDGFVEVEGAQLVGAFESARTVVEFSDAAGAKLVVRLSGREELDIVGLAEAFWGRGE